jgi:hypothetical protein
MLDAVFFDRQMLFVILGDARVIGAELLNEAAVARRAGVRHHELVVGLLLGADTGESDLQRHDVSFV